MYKTTPQPRPSLYYIGQILLPKGVRYKNTPLHSKRVLYLLEGITLTHITFAILPTQAMNTSNSGQPWFVDPLALRRSVSAYPSLQAALFPPPLTSLSPSHSQDISVYQLLQVSITLYTSSRLQYTLTQVSNPNYTSLQGNVPFNISRLFKWQSTNRSGHEEGTAGGCGLYIESF